MKTIKKAIKGTTTNATGKPTKLQLTVVSDAERELYRVPSYGYIL